MYVKLQTVKKNAKKPSCHFGEQINSDICPGYAYDIRYRNDEINIASTCMNCKRLRENMEARQK